jgi:HPr kinase/phosphorylase
MPDQEVTLHGTFLNLFGVGTHIMGEPGIGKSELALALLYRHHQLIADDFPFFALVNHHVIGSNPFPRHFLSIRGIGLMDVPSLFGATSVLENQILSLIIHLQMGKTDALSHLEGEESTKDILGCLIPCLTIPIINPRNLPVLVETMVKIYLLKMRKEIPPVTHLEKLLREKMELGHS